MNVPGRTNQSAAMPQDAEAGPSLGTSKPGPARPAGQLGGEGRAGPVVVAPGSAPRAPRGIVCFHCRHTIVPCTCRNWRCEGWVHRLTGDHLGPALPCAARPRKESDVQRSSAGDGSGRPSDPPAATGDGPDTDLRVRLSREVGAGYGRASDRDGSRERRDAPRAREEQPERSTEVIQAAVDQLDVLHIFEVRYPELADANLICTACGEIVCTIEHLDQMDVLVRTAIYHWINRCST